MVNGLSNPNIEQDTEIYYLSFNQNGNCISVGMKNGYRIYNCEPFGKCFHDTDGGIGIAQMLFCTSLVALVGAGNQPAFSPRRLRIWNTKTQTSICELNFVTAILTVQLNRQRVVIVLEDKVYIANLKTMDILETLETAPNPRGLAVLSNMENGHLVFPSGSTPGELMFYDTMNLSVLNAVQVHKSNVVAMALNDDASLLATASDTGTVIRVHTVPHGKRIFVFRRGSYPARIYCLAFSPDASILCASSDTGTIHVFSMSDGANTATGSFGSMSTLGGYLSTSKSDEKLDTSKIKGYFPTALKDLAQGTRDFAFARLRDPGIPNLCAAKSPVEGSAKIMVATVDGHFYQYVVDMRKGGECRLERENLLQDSQSEQIEASFLTKD